jgi:quercetin dioxygenase-like cupin family protein
MVNETVISAGGPVTPTMVEKAWGGELWFAVVDNAYAGKVIDIAAGQAVSLHRHRAKTETIIVLSGTGVAELGPTRNNLTSYDLRPGTCVHIPPMMIHRFSADTALRFVEVSTASDGWIDDVERIEDRFGLAAAQEG